MELSELWLEDLFRIYMGCFYPGSSEQLQTGPFQGRPAAYNPAAFGNPSDRQIEQTITDKLQLKRQQEDVGSLGYYIRFVNEKRGVTSEPHRTALRNWIRYPRVYVTNANEYETGKHNLLMSFQAYEQRIWTMRGDRATEARFEGDRQYQNQIYSGGLSAFIQTIGAIRDLASESILTSMAQVNLEIDFHVSSSALPRLVNSPYERTREGARAAVQAWNALTPRQRAALANRSGELRNALDEKYEAMHERRNLPIPDYVPS